MKGSAVTILTIKQVTMPAAELGRENPLPVFRDANPDMKVTCDGTVPESDKTYMGWQCSNRVLPHRMQDGYGRQMTPRQFTAVVLENEHLRAVVLPEIGGRLASLLDKASGIELLEPVKDLQPANIALRNAWIAGGVEWNTAQLGHHYLTCSPMFAAMVNGPEGEPVLRLYAWERTKQFAYQIDLHLPSDSRFLFARVRIVNPHDEVLPMYWWTNIAVPETPDRRVIAPANSAIYNHPKGLSVMELPTLDGRDVTYSTNNPYAKEFFFRIEQSRPWVTSLDGRGQGLVHTSTSLLRGRKMFVWGAGPGGQRWQEHLLGPGRAYVEIQAGLARTQLESLPMPRKSEWAWTEAFGLLEADPIKVHSDDWVQARSAVQGELERALSESRLSELDAKLSHIATSEPDEVISFGEGWGSLEALRAGRPYPGLPFPGECLGEDQAQWLSLLRDGVLPERDPVEGPGHYVVQPEWQALLEESISAGKSDHWLGWLHLGVMKLEAFDNDGAVEAWRKSIEHKPTAWAYRNLAVIENRAGNFEAGYDMFRRAWEAGPHTASLAVEYASALEKADKWDELRQFAAGLPGDISTNERILFVRAKLALRYDDLSEVEEILSHEFATIREGETMLTDLWFAWQAKLLSEREGVAVDEELMARVRRELTPPHRLDMRTAGERA